MLTCERDMDEPAGFYSSTDRVARKEHRCTECKGAIQSGQRYRLTAGKWNGRIESFKTCERCCTVWDALQELGYCISHEYLIEDYQDYLDMTGSKKKAREILCT